MSLEPSPKNALQARALWFTAPRTVEFRSEIVPPPGPDEVRVETVASAISHGTEMLVFRGEVPASLPLDLPTLAGSYAFPIKYGYATVGRILDVGLDVEDLDPGDPVFVHHPHQDKFSVPAEMAVRLPGGLDPLLGIFVANLETAVNIVHDTPVHLGETALVLGQGVVGLLVSQLLKLAGAYRVLVVDPLEKRRTQALSIGVEEALEPDALPDSILKATGGRGADVVVEISGAGTALQAAVDAVADEGTVVVASWYGTKPVSLDLGGHFHRGRLRIRSSQVGRLNPELSPRWDRSRRMRTALELLPRLHLKEFITHRFSFEQAPQAYQLVDECPDEVVQVVLTYDECRGG